MIENYYRYYFEHVSYNDRNVRQIITNQSINLTFVVVVVVDNNSIVSYVVNEDIVYGMNLMAVYLAHEIIDFDVLCIKFLIQINEK